MDRPRPPEIKRPFKMVEYVTDGDLLRVVAWAREWVGEPVMHSDREIAEFVRISVNEGTKFSKVKYGEVPKNVIAAATRYISLRAQIERYRSVGETGDWHYLFCEGYHSCEAATARDRSTGPVSSTPIYPLPGCDLSECRCSIRFEPNKSIPPAKSAPKARAKSSSRRVSRKPQPGFLSTLFDILKMFR